MPFPTATGGNFALSRPITRVCLSFSWAKKQKKPSSSNRRLIKVQSDSRYCTQYCLGLLGSLPWSKMNSMLCSPRMRRTTSMPVIISFGSGSFRIGSPGAGKVLEREVDESAHDELMNKLAAEI